MSNETQIARREDEALERVRPGRRSRPAVDIFENQDELLLYADVPGITSSDLSVELNEGLLHLEARRELTRGEETEPECLIYVRSFQMPSGIDPEKIRANLKDGVLEVHLPKMEALKPRRIHVKAG